MESSTYLGKNDKQLLEQVKQFFGFGDNPDFITIYLPRVKRSRGVSLTCKNYPLYDYEVSPDDVYTALRIYSLLVLLYGDKVQVLYSPDVKIMPEGHRVIIGSPVTNVFCSGATDKQFFAFGKGKEDHDIVDSKNGKHYKVVLDGDDGMDLSNRSIVLDYTLISKRTIQNKVEIVLAGCRAYGQLLLWYILKDQNFYDKTLPEVKNKDFQILIEAKVNETTCTGWEIVKIHTIPSSSIPPRKGPKPKDTITWLHLSDIHFQIESGSDSRIVLDALLKDIRDQSENNGYSPDFIVITGDLSFSGKKEEFDEATNFLDRLLKETKVLKERLFVVPGNHDINGNAITPMASFAASSLKNSQIVNEMLNDPDDRRTLFRRFENYKRFFTDFFGPKRRFDSDHYFYTQSFNIGNWKLAILGLNSAWLCAPDTDKSDGLLLGEKQIETALSETEDADIRIALVHHPFDWLKDFDQRDSGQLLREKCQFVLHGHLHETGVRQLAATDNTAFRFAAGASSHNRNYPDTYNFVQISKNSGKLILRRYSEPSPGFWTSDTLTYKDAPDGTYIFPFQN